VAREPAEYEKLATNPVELADDVSVVDSYDVSKLLHYFSDKRPAAIVAFDDYRLIPAAVVAEHLGLPHTSVSGLVNAHFKDRTRDLTKGIGHPIEAVRVDLDAPGESSPIGYPCVVKPIDDSGSTGVRICDSDSEYAAALEQIAENDINLRNYHCARHALVEEFIAGDEYTAELVWSREEDGWLFLGFTKKLMAEPPYRVELGAMFPYVFGAGQDLYVENVVRSWLAAIGHEHGAAHVEFKLVDGEPALMEVNPRLGGDQIRELMLLTRGIDSIGMYLRAQLGLYPGTSLHPDAEGTPPHVDRKYATILYLTPPRVGRINHVRPPQSADPRVVRHSLTTGPFTSRGVIDNDDRLGYVITIAAEFDESYRVAKDFMEQVKVEY
jgi:biotin carboxylase